MDWRKGIVFLIGSLLLISTTVAPATPPEWVARLAPEIIKRAHKYHGILVSYEDSKGHFFLRDGVRCKLITNDFLREDNNDF